MASGAANSQSSAPDLGESNTLSAAPVLSAVPEKSPHSETFLCTISGRPDFANALNEIQQKHAIPSLVTYEAAWILLIWIVRGWRVSQATTAAKRIWTQAWIAAIFWPVSLIVIPILVWGEPYKTLLSHACKAILKILID